MTKVIRVGEAAEIVLAGVLSQLPTITPKDLRLIFGRAADLHAERYVPPRVEVDPPADPEPEPEPREPSKVRAMRMLVSALRESQPKPAAPPPEPSQPNPSGRGARLRYPHLIEEIDRLKAEQPELTCAVAYRMYEAKLGPSFVAYPSWRYTYWRAERRTVGPHRDRRTT